MYSSSYNPHAIYPKHTKIEQPSIEAFELDPTSKASVKILREGKSYKCGLCMTLFKQKDYYLNHLRNEHWNQQDIKAYNSRFNDQKFNSKFSKPITENLVKRPRVNIISEQDIMRNEQELNQRITFTSNMVKPGDKSGPKAFEMKMFDADTKRKEAEAKKKISIPPPRKRVRKGKRKPLFLKKRDFPTSEEETRASFSNQKGKFRQEFTPQKKLKVRSK